MKPEMLLSKKKKIKGDEGHPPPCEESGEHSKKCPTEPLKKPQIQEKTHEYRILQESRRSLH